METATQEFKVWDRVWTMYDNKPTKLVIYSVTEKMDTIGTCRTRFSYTTVREALGAGQGNNKDYGVDPKKIFRTKEELIQSL